MKEKIEKGAGIFIAMVCVILIICLFFAVFLSYGEDPPKKQRLAQDTVKMDTVKLKKQQQIYKRQMTEQSIWLDQLIEKKKESLKDTVR